MTVNQDVFVDIQQVPLNTFLEVVSRDIVSGFAYPSFKMAYNIWAEFKDQKKVLLVVGDKRDFIDVNYNIRLGAEELRRYGVYLETLDAVNEDRIYLIVISKDITEENLKEYCDEYVLNYLPEGKIPSYFILEREITSLDQVSYWTKLVSDIFPNCQSLNSYKNLQEEEDQRIYQARMQEILREAGIQKLDIENLFNQKINVSASASATRNTERLWPSLLELVQEVRNLYEETKSSLPPKTRLFLTFDGKLDSRKANFCAYMFYEYGIPSYFDSVAMFELYTSGISTLQFNSGRMLIEDQINYVKEFPDLSLVRAEANDFVAISLNRGIRNENDWLEGKIRVKALEVISNEEMSGVPIDMNLDINDITIFPLQNYFKSLSSNDVEYIRKEASVIVGKEEYGRLLSGILSLGEALVAEGHTEEMSPQYLVDLTKVLMFEYEGKLYFSYVYNWDFSFQVILKTMDPSQPSMVIKVDRENLHRFLPVMSLPFKVETFQQTLVNCHTELYDAYKQIKSGDLSSRTQKTKDFLEFLKMYSPTLKVDELLLRAGYFRDKNPGRSMTRRYKHDNAIGLLLETFYRKEHTFIFSPGQLHKITNPGLTFKVIGLWCPKTVLVRQRLLGIMSRNVRIREHRKRYNFFSVFGGPLPIFEDTVYHITDKVDITEEFLKE